MSQNIDVMGIIVDCGIIAIGLVLIFSPLNGKRIRARWANSLFVIGGLVGIITHVVKLMLDSHWLTLSLGTNQVVHISIYYGNGLVLGFLFALIFSGQANGIKRPEQVSA